MCTWQLVLTAMMLFFQVLLKHCLRYEVDMQLYINIVLVLNALPMSLTVDLLVPPL